MFGRARSGHTPAPPTNHEGLPAVLRSAHAEHLRMQCFARWGPTNAKPMDTESSRGDSVDWQRATVDDRREPVRRAIPYVEAVLEYRDLEPTRYGGAFFPSAVPYSLGSEDRVFYWQQVLDATTPPSDGWTAICATPHGVQPTTTCGPVDPRLTSDDGETVLVEGTVGGDATEAELADPVAHAVSIERIDDDAAVVSASGDHHRVQRGQRAELWLDATTVRLADGTETTTTPVLTVRYPGDRAFYHPAVDATYRLFPSFGLDLADVPRSLDVSPGANVDPETVAGAFDVDLSERPYAERVLWQAFVHTAFVGNAPPTLAQFDDGLLAVWPGG